MTTHHDKWRVFDILGYVPTEGQAEIHQSEARLRLVAGGERAGKSRAGASEVLSQAIVEANGFQGTVLIWLVADRYEFARPEFSYIVDGIQDIGILSELSFPQSGPCRAIARWPGCAVVVETKSARDPTTLRAKAPHLVLLCEAASVSYDAFLRLLGRLSEHRGSLLATGTFEEAYGWYPDLWAEWRGGEGGQSFSLPSWSNTYIFPGGRDDPEIRELERRYSGVEGLFDLRCGGVPSPPVGLVFRGFSHLHHINPDHGGYRPGDPVFLGVDPSRGTNPYAVVVCQFRIGDEVRVIDCVYERGRICEEVIEICKARPWWGDVAGGAIGHDAPDDRERWGSYAQVWLESKVIHEEHLIRRIQSFLHHDEVWPPKLLIASANLPIVREFGLWRRHDANNKPIDRDNHALKALGYLLVNKFGFVGSTPRPRRVSFTEPSFTVISRRGW